MGTYSAGNKTKRKIEYIARYFFMIDGVENTTYAKIADAANVNIGTIVYHYKSLDVLAGIVYEDILTKRAEVYMQKVKEAFPDKEFSSTALNFAQYRVNTQSYLDYPGYAKFIAEQLYKSATWKTPGLDHSFVALCNEHNLKISKNDLNLHKYMFLPFAAMVTNAINDGVIESDAKTICEYQMKIRLSSVGLPMDEIEKILADVDLIASKVSLKIDSYMNIS